MSVSGFHPVHLVKDHPVAACVQPGPAVWTLRHIIRCCSPGCRSSRSGRSPM